MKIDIERAYLGVIRGKPCLIKITAFDIDARVKKCWDCSWIDLESGMITEQDRVSNSELTKRIPTRLWDEATGLAKVFHSEMRRIHHAAIDGDDDEGQDGQ